MIYTGKGYINYCNTWAYVQVPFDFIRYYRLVILHTTGKVIQLPEARAHITLVAGRHEKPKNKEFWGKYEGEKIKFKYDNKINYQHPYFWVVVECKRLQDIRVELGLKPNLKWPFHITIGNLK